MTGMLYPKRPKPPQGWPSMPAKPAFVSKHTAERQPVLPSRITPHADSPRTPMEKLSRLAGGTTYRTPDNSREARGGISTEDVAYALGFVTDPLEQRLALALACGTDAEWAEVQALAYPQLLSQLRASYATRAMVAGPLRYRIRLVLHDVFHDLALQRAPREPRQSARRIRMTMRDYKALYKAIAGFVETRAQAGAYSAKCALHNDG